VLAGGNERRAFLRRWCSLAHPFILATMARRSSQLALAFFVMLSAACHTHDASDPRCARLVDKVLVCDPTSHGVPRANIEGQCIDSRLHCGDLDTSTPEGCQHFMGCLYDG
jgi:hypothetical protein